MTASPFHHRLGRGLGLALAGQGVWSLIWGRLAGGLVAALTAAMLAGRFLGHQAGAGPAIELVLAGTAGVAAYLLTLHRYRPAVLRRTICLLQGRSDG